MNDPITIRLDDDLQQLLDEAVKLTGRNRSELVRDILRRRLEIVLFREARRRIMPYAEAAGFLTDEDVFREMS